MPDRTPEETRLRREVCAYSALCDDYRTALTRILKWARDNSTKNTYDDGSVTRLFLRRSFDLFQILADAGFEIDSDDHLVIHGERVVTCDRCEEDFVEALSVGIECEMCPRCAEEVKEYE